MSSALSHYELGHLACSADMARRLRTPTPWFADTRMSDHTLVLAREIAVLDRETALESTRITRVPVDTRALATPLAICTTAWWIRMSSASSSYELG